jgi:hypothetical protein
VAADRSQNDPPPKQDIGPWEASFAGSLNVRPNDENSTDEAGLFEDGPLAIDQSKDNPPPEQDGDPWEASFAGSTGAQPSDESGPPALGQLEPSYAGSRDRVTGAACSRNSSTVVQQQSPIETAW